MFACVTEDRHPAAAAESDTAKRLPLKGLPCCLLTGVHISPEGHGEGD